MKMYKTINLIADKLAADRDYSSCQAVEDLRQIGMTNKEIEASEQYAEFVLDKGIARAQQEIDELNKKLEVAVKKKTFDDFHSLAIKNIFELRRVIRTLEIMKENLKNTTSDYIECA